MTPRSNYLAFGAPDFTDQEIEAVTRIMRSGWVGMGPETIAFEQELSAHVGAPEVVTVNSCTAALFLSLLVEGIGPGDEVIVPSLTWCATANAALYLGATPVFCDVDANTMSITPDTVAAKITAKTRAVIVVHYGGLAQDVNALKKVLPPHVCLIEDAAHALGARYPDGTPVGSSGNLTCFSFYANKNISTAEGGAIALHESSKAERLRSLRMSGLESSAWARYGKSANAMAGLLAQLGYKMNYTDLQAAIGRVQLRRLPEMDERRRLIAHRYRQCFAELGIPVRFQSEILEQRHARHLLVGDFSSLCDGRSRNELLINLRRVNIGAAVHYHPLHTQPLYNPSAQPALPVTELLADTILTLPISARMMETDVDDVVQAIIHLTKSPDKHA